MDIVLGKFDELLLTPHVYPVSWKEDWWIRQSISLFGITVLGGYAVYLGFAYLNYQFFFDKRYKKHSKYLEDQIRKEITCACRSIPYMTLFTLPIFVLEVNGYSQLYDDLLHYGYGYLFASIILFLFFNDMLIYWIHRWLHHPLIYKHVHKEHHRWLIPTPFASHAFHPLDGFLQSTPYHIFVFIFPLHKAVYLGLFILVNFWTISIHDGHYQVPGFMKHVINGAAHHTDHHLMYNYNYGQYFTLWDRLGGSYRDPSDWDGKSPLEELAKSEKKVA